MSDDEVIRFEITDYDLENEFNIRGRRATKEQQIYGVWAKDSDEEDNEDNMRQKTRKPKAYSAPIGFVTGGVQQAGKKKAKQDKELLAPEPVKPLSDSSDSDTPAPDAQDTAGIRQGVRANLGGSLGHWEKHTKGIGAKLLLQMGYQPGKGLGKDLQGISAPVEAALRKGRGAIGAYGPEKSAQLAKKAEEKRLKEKEVKDEGEAKKSYHWKKSHKGRYFYRDAADVIQEGKPTLHTIASNSLSQVPVIDMTGRSRRVLSGYHALLARAPRYEHEPRRDCTHFSAPELTHNLHLCVDLCEQDIIQNARELQSAEDEIVVLERDLTECTVSITEHDAIIDTMQVIIQKLEELNEPDVSLEDVFLILEDMMERFPLEYGTFGVGAAGGAELGARAVPAGWRPLAAPALPLPAVRRARPLLPPAALSALLHRHVLSAIHTDAGSWNPRMPEPMLKVYEVWSEVVPEPELRQSVARSVLPALHEAVRQWDPTRDTQPLHDWVLPWHRYIGLELSVSVYPLIRSRLAAALSSWHPADGSARPLLEVWREVWGGALQTLVQTHIVPKLEACLQEAPIELVGRENSAWLWCVEWCSLAGAGSLAAVCGRALLPRWLAALAAWLNSGPEHSAVISSYTNFRKTFPEEILKEPVVRDSFRKALDMMNRSADIETPLEAPPPPRISVPEPKDISRLAEAIASGNTQKSFSELLESKCTEKGITFVPIAGKSREGRPVYKIGATMQCYILRNVIMYSSDSGRTYIPISMDKLLKIAED